MRFFAGEEKKMRDEREQKLMEEKRRQEQEREEQVKEDRKKAREDEFMKELEKKTEKKKIITLILSDYEGNDWKELAMNYLLEKGYVCVQNDISCTRTGAHYALTFVRKDHVGFFLTNR